MIYFLLAISTIATAIVLLSSYRYWQLCQLREEHLAIDGPSYGVYQDVAASFTAWKGDAITMNKLGVKMAYIAPFIVGIRSVTHGVKVDEINIAKQYPENS